MVPFKPKPHQKETGSSESFTSHLRNLFRASDIFILQDMKVGHFRNVYGLCQHLLSKCKGSWKPNIRSLFLCNADSKGGQSFIFLRLKKYSPLWGRILGQTLKSPFSGRTNEWPTPIRFPHQCAGYPSDIWWHLVWTLQLPAPRDESLPCCQGSSSNN